MDFEFIETDIFTKRVQMVLTDEEYGLLQASLIVRPDAGVLIPHGKGLRKLRWSFAHKGKRGGARVIYYLYLNSRKIYMLYIFKKSEQSDLTSAQLNFFSEYFKERKELL